MSESIIDFGRVCRGESQVRKLSLRNTGALGTELTIRKVGREINGCHGQQLLLFAIRMCIFVRHYVRTYSTMHLSVVSAA